MTDDVKAALARIKTLAPEGMTVSYLPRFRASDHEDRTWTMQIVMGRVGARAQFGRDDDDTAWAEVIAEMQADIEARTEIASKMSHPPATSEDA